jgi:hypothetical protein
LLVAAVREGGVEHPTGLASEPLGGRPSCDALQVTYRGQPLYLYVGDAPGRTLCHDVSEFGGLWLVLRASGRALS